MVVDNHSVTPCASVYNSSWVNQGISILAFLLVSCHNSRMWLLPTNPLKFLRFIWHQVYTHSWLLIWEVRPKSTITLSAHAHSHVIEHLATYCSWLVIMCTEIDNQYTGYTISLSLLLFVFQLHLSSHHNMSRHWTGLHSRQLLMRQVVPHLHNYVVCTEVVVFIGNFVGHSNDDWHWNSPREYACIMSMIHTVNCRQSSNIHTTFFKLFTVEPL